MTNHQSDSFYKSILDQLHDGVYFVDIDRRITYWNQGAELLTGYASEDMLGTRCPEGPLRHSNAAGQILCNTSCPLAAAIREREPQEAEVFFTHKHGYHIPIFVRAEPIRDERGSIVGAVEIFRDNSPRLAARARINELENQANRDHLTGLANRRYAEAFMQEAFSSLGRLGWSMGVIIADIDHFKRVNDKYGHDVGDRVLQMVASTLQATARTSDLVSRWGGEEFLSLIVNVNGEQLGSIAERYRHLVEAASLDLNGGQIKVTISCGAAMRRPEDDLASLIQRADRCLYRSKAAGRNCSTIDAADAQAPGWS